MTTMTETFFAENVPELYAVQLADVGDRFELDGRGGFLVASKVFSAVEHPSPNEIMHIQTKLFLTREFDSHVLSTPAGATSRHFMRKDDTVSTPNGMFYISYKSAGYRDHNGLYFTSVKLRALNAYLDPSAEATPNDLTEEEIPPSSPENSTSFEPTVWPWLYWSEVMKLCRPGDIYYTAPGNSTPVAHKTFIARENQWDLRVSTTATELELLTETAQTLAPYAASGDNLILSGLSYKVKGKVFKLNSTTQLYSVGLIYQQL
ncbi:MULTISPECIES: hypothetical protein [unclassified Pseudomonas]|uniref:hypothetical protein n=1 Tax=unclassified Pseudomonas TaxID=196821 RepID=UPI000C88A2C3|nr:MULTISPECIES: hypothetical protein [unclassified Pseudomonas]PMZ88916.1 hypothetical protein C1X61_12845 [Pseudomonas sp. FW215-T2]PNA10779.1 hypothetical protein C1X62_17045 [Pseudomonas sp. FW215-R3]PNB39026.1 hypothetical protein C1X63_04640 [Pseudomonas sp. FW305-131]